jgi:hypothetical protein
MQGALALHRGLLWIGRHEKTAHVRAFDLDGRALGPGFSFRDERAGRSEVSGLAIDDERRLWVADRAAGLVRCFTVFGREVLTLGPGLDGDTRDTLGVAAAPVGVAVRGDADDLVLLVASGGRRRYALQLYELTDNAPGRVAWLRSGGDPHGRFDGLRGVSWRDDHVYAAEAGAGRVQVFRDGDFHFAFRVAGRPGARFEPTAVAPLRDGRLVVAHGGANGGVLLCDRSGALLRVLAEAGSGEGQLFEPADVVVAEGGDDRETRVVVIDRDGDRVQVFTLDGRCFGAFEDLTG